MLNGNNSSLTNNQIAIADTAYESYKKAHILIDAFENIGINVEGIHENGKIGSLFGIMDDQLKIIGSALNIDWLSDDNKISRFENAIESSLDIEDNKPGIPHETLETLLAMRD